MKNIIAFWITFTLFPLHPCNAHYLNNPNNRIEDAPLIWLTGWQYFTGTQTSDSTKWIQLNSLSDISQIEDYNIILLRTKLPEWHGRSPALYIGQIDHFLQVYLNDELIYELGDSSSLRTRSIIGLNQNLVELPSFNKGDSLTLKVSTDNTTINILNNILLSSSGKIIRNVFNNNISALFFAAFFLFIGFSILIVYFSIFKSKLLIGIFAFITSLAFYLLSNSLFLQLLFEAPSLYYHIDYIALLSNTTSGFYAVAQIIDKKYEAVLKVIWRTHFIVLLLVTTIINITDTTFTDLFLPFTILLSISMITCLGSMILSAKSGNYESKLLSVGMSGFFLFAGIEIFLYLKEGLYTDFGASIKVLHFGALCFVTSLIWIVVRNYLNTKKMQEVVRQRELEAVKRENESRQKYAVQLLESQENERNRIALELHDSLGQKLLLINNQLYTRIRKEKDPDSFEPLKRIRNITNEAIQEIRDILWNLRPQHLDQLGVTAAVETLVEKIGKSSEIKFRLTIDNIDGLVPLENKINVYRIIQESLNNIVKHSKATEAFVNIKRNGNTFFMEIRDNGIGGNHDINKKGFGLTGMYERADMLGAKLNIEFSETWGTKVTMQYQPKQNKQ
ncbi:MAG: sensor histidine kinase [Ignavibacteria bacterium]